MRQDHIIAALRSYGPMTTTQILDRLGLKDTHPMHTTCNSQLNKMRKWGEVEKVGTVGAGKHTAFIWAVVE